MHGLTCEACGLKIEKKGTAYSYTKPGFVVPTKLQDSEVLKRAYETGLCPLCGFEMEKL